MTEQNQTPDIADDEDAEGHVHLHDQAAIQHAHFAIEDDDTEDDDTEGHSHRT